MKCWTQALDQFEPSHIQLVLITDEPPSIHPQEVLVDQSRLFVTQWTVACQAAQPMGFSRQEYWNGYPFRPPGDLPDPEITSRSFALQADSLPSERPGKPSHSGPTAISRKPSSSFLSKTCQKSLLFSVMGINVLSEIRVLLSVITVSCQK